MEQRQDYLEKQINNLGLVLNKILSNADLLDKEDGTERFFSLAKEHIGADLQNTVVSKDLLSALIDADQINRDNILDIVDILLLLENNGNTSILILKNALTMLDYVQTRSQDYSFDIHLKMKKIEEKLPDRTTKNRGQKD